MLPLFSANPFAHFTNEELSVAEMMCVSSSMAFEKVPAKGRDLTFESEVVTQRGTR